ncbi:MULTISPECIES: metalloregulator ArsR/SmtB family transcription factor [Rhodomicrobium]|uniref:ArsR/SmtB family transcription factor n=1 Tax=Rhodomicrobium TaxID=1068 RepID=UPI000B4B0FE2|nr:MULTISPECIES: metalloregulator ArsR/SmtB family transcription factor [Rhodomicrobium]
MQGAIPAAELVEILRSAGETTRLRLLMLLAHGEFNVKDLTQILGQSQPRLSRHLKLLAEARLIERFQEGSSVFYRLAEHGPGAAILTQLLAAIDPKDALIGRDLARADGLRQEKSAAAQAYFEAHAAAWDEIRSHHAPEAAVEAAMLTAMGQGPFELLIDLGTGTGRILELFAARAARLAGFDVNREMLAHARARLAAGGVRNAQLRLGDIFNLPLETGAAEAVVIHQVLHFLEEPAKAVAEAARLLKPGGRLLIVDFAPHDLESMREDYAHRRLGFERELVEDWLKREGLTSGHYEAIRPAKKAEGKLTVSLWMAVKPPERSRKKREAAETVLEG